MVAVIKHAMLSPVNLQLFTLAMSFYQTEDQENCVESYKLYFFSGRVTGRGGKYEMLIKFAAVN